MTEPIDIETLVRHNTNPFLISDNTVKDLVDALTVYMTQRERMARLDEWNYIEVIRESSDNAILKEQEIRIEALKDQLGDKDE